MWPFEDSLRNQLRNQDLLKKYREWLRKWLYKGNNSFNPFTITVAVLVVALISAGGFYYWSSNQQVKDAMTTKDTSQMIDKDWKQVPPVSNNAQADASKQTTQTTNNEQKTTSIPAINPEEMVKPVMGHVLTGVGMTFSEVFKDYRYNTGVALSAEPGTEVKAVLPGIVSLVATGERDTKVVSINHGNGWESSYSGLKETTVKAGQELKENDILGTLGEFSRTNGVLENHLYVKVTKDGEPVDPNIYWK